MGGLVSNESCPRAPHRLMEERRRLTSPLADCPTKGVPPHYPHLLQNTVQQYCYVSTIIVCVKYNVLYLFVVYRCTKVYVLFCVSTLVDFSAIFSRAAFFFIFFASASSLLLAFSVFSLSIVEVALSLFLLLASLLTLVIASW